MDGQIGEAELEEEEAGIEWIANWRYSRCTVHQHAPPHPPQAISPSAGHLSSILTKKRRGKAALSIVVTPVLGTSAIARLIAEVTILEGRLWPCAAAAMFAMVLRWFIWLIAMVTEAGGRLTGIRGPAGSGAKTPGTEKEENAALCPFAIIVLLGSPRRQAAWRKERRRRVAAAAANAAQERGKEDVAVVVVVVGAPELWSLEVLSGDEFTAVHPGLDGAESSEDADLLHIAHHRRDLQPLQLGVDRDGVEYTGLLGGRAAVGMPGLPVARSSDLNRFCPGPDGGARDGDGDEVVDGGDVVAEGVEIGGGGTRGVGGIRAAGTAMVTYRRGRE
ncbi:hypothetical protein INR49_030366 [Caranx melampygus]|nr:hypothetical protein INR49_030366 [Caranx melampygus]